MEAAETVPGKQEHVSQLDVGGRDTAKGSLRDSAEVRGKAKPGDGDQERRSRFETGAGRGDCEATGERIVV